MVWSGFSARPGFMRDTQSSTEIETRAAPFTNAYNVEDAEPQWEVTHDQDMDRGKFSTVGSDAWAESGSFPDYVAPHGDKFKAEFEDNGAVPFGGETSQPARINYEIGGETGAANAFPYQVVGPVTGKNSRMSGLVTPVRRRPEGIHGPVTGTGQDYANQLAMAYFAEDAARVVAEQSQASLMAAI